MTVPSASWIVQRKRSLRSMLVVEVMTSVKADSKSRWSTSRKSMVSIKWGVKDALNGIKKPRVPMLMPIMGGQGPLANIDATCSTVPSPPRLTTRSTSLRCRVELPAVDIALKQKEQSVYISLTLVQNHNIRSQVLPELSGQVFLDDQIYMTVMLSSIAQYVFCSFQSLQVVLLLDEENIAGLGDPLEGMRAAACRHVSLCLQAPDA